MDGLYNARMTRDEVLNRLHACPLVASVQASPGSTVDDPKTLLKLGQASQAQGVTLLRLQGFDNIKTIREGTGLPAFGLIKRTYEGTPVYITATKREVDEILSTGSEIVTLDGTARPRPNNEQLADLIAYAHQRGALVLADIDTVESADYATKAGADFLSTTLAGYTDEQALTRGPDLEVLRQVVKQATIPVFAEGRFTQAWEVEAARRIGAIGVIVGGALNDPVKQTIALKPPEPPADGKQIGAIDIGGTWLRFARFSPDWKMLDSHRTPNPPTREDRLAWIRDRIAESNVERIGVSTGGIVDPETGIVWKAKEYLMHDHIGIEFSTRTLGIPTHAFGDGHATAWAHANLPEFAGLRVATLAIGTGLGAGFVREGKLWCGRRGEYPRVNDLPAPGGGTYEDLLGGIHLTKDPSEEQQANAITALEEATKAVRNLYFPDILVIGGSVGLSPWLAPHLARLDLIPSSLGGDAGLYGAAALALYPTYW